MPPNDYDVEPSIPCACGQISEVAMQKPGTETVIDICIPCLCKLFPEDAPRILRTYRAFHLDVYGYEPNGLN